MRINWAAVALACPPVALCAFLSVVIALSVAGRNPFWPDQRVNVAEAIAANDDATLLQLMEGGADLSRVYEIRAGLLTDSSVKATPLEVSVLAHRIDVLDRLLKTGARLDAASWGRVRCLADSPEAIAILENYRPDGAMLPCLP